MNELKIYMDQQKKVKTVYGIAFECVELARRFYNQYYGLTFPSIRDADEFFRKIDALIHTGNNQLVLLQTIMAPNIDRICVGDAIFWKRLEKNTNYGHVGIVVYSDGKKVVIAQQNQKKPLKEYATSEILKKINIQNGKYLGIKRMPDWIPKPVMIYVKVI
jgi:hypothetical protein